MRSGPLKRKTPLTARQVKIKRDEAKARAFLDRARTPLPAISEKRKRQLPKRADVRREVIARAGNRCEGVDVVPEISCGFYPPERPWLEVDELHGGAARASEWLDPSKCQALCPAHHDYKTAHKNEYLMRRADLIHPNRRRVAPSPAEPEPGA